MAHDYKRICHTIQYMRLSFGKSLPTGDTPAGVAMLLEHNQGSNHRTLGCDRSVAASRGTPCIDPLCSGVCTSGPEPLLPLPLPAPRARPRPLLRSAHNVISTTAVHAEHGTGAVIRWQRQQEGVRGDNFLGVCFCKETGSHVHASPILLKHGHFVLFNFR
jgi:hypothetical protein